MRGCAGTRGTGVSAAVGPAPADGGTIHMLPLSSIFSLCHRDTSAATKGSNSLGGWQESRKHKCVKALTSGHNLRLLLKWRRKWKER